MVDAFVRPARPDDAVAVARLQLATWRIAYAQVIPATVLDALEEDEVAAQWHSAIVEPPTPRHRLLVAYEGAEIVGFAAIGPASGEDLVGPGYASEAPTAAGEWDATALLVNTLLVEPRWGRRGHGSRLLAAVADLARQQGFTRAVAWVLEADQATRSLLESTGWAPDGVGRVLDMDGTEVAEIRLVTDLTPADPQ
ncbi:GNAT family N-acetyltransferase [Cryptosporangium aurantiacum]|uniref:L-amino acid N-acyltransferase YncA n=1 Tax=Cryptosporangium aurantiacum TaxID=134849 RepID=A0A1M7IR21_9ACTN|nr:GNAT family N-acetyltransferase [Cryptosporangium aurantiacum]SHM43048.1 L-amino acid N-acyltransferase YncA [Cryptosporangium aurantiacum]